jgi:tellurite resistance protein TehA-like permease
MRNEDESVAGSGAAENGLAETAILAVVVIFGVTAVLLIPIILRLLLPFGMPPENLPRLLTIGLPFLLVGLAARYVYGAL